MSVTRNGHYLDNAGLEKLWNLIKSTFVAKVSGKGLSTNDYTTEEKDKLAGIAAGAEVNVQSDWNVTSSSSDAYTYSAPTSITRWCRPFLWKVLQVSSIWFLPAKVLPRTTMRSTCMSLRPTMWLHTSRG